MKERKLVRLIIKKKERRGIRGEGRKAGKKIKRERRGMKERKLKRKMIVCAIKISYLMRKVRKAIWKASRFG